MIYFVHDEPHGSLKIGCSGNVPSRLSSIQTDNPAALVLLGTLPGDRPEEARLHDLFAAWRGKGEWFRADVELLAAVRLLLSKNGTPQTVAEELERRNNCRFGLRGVKVGIIGAHDEARVVRSSRWGAGEKLLLMLEGDERPTEASRCVLLSEWPVVCRCWCEEGAA